MISIRSVANELDRMEESLRTVIDVYGQGIYSVAQYIVEVHPDGAGEFRTHLQALQRQVVAAETPEQWRQIQANLRGELRSYHEKARGEIEGLQAEIRAAGEAVRIFSESIAATDSDHETLIKHTLKDLDAVSQSDDLEGVRAGIRSVADSISESIVVMQRSHQAAIAQMRDEIRVLQKQVDVERHAHLLDPTTGTWNRESLDSRVAELTAAGRPFCLMVVHVRNLSQLRARYSRGVVDTCLRALLKRLEGMLGKGAMIGRWDEQSFAAILEIPAVAAMSLSRSVTQTLSGAYTAQENGVSESLSLVAVAGIIDWAAGMEETAYQRKLRQMSEALTGA